MSVRVEVITIRSEEGFRENREEALSGAVESALHILNFSQTQFQFEFGPAENKLSPLTATRGVSSAESKELTDHAPDIVSANNTAFHTWADLEDLVTNEKVRLAADYLIAVLDEPIESNWFSRAVPGKNVSFITTWSWDYISNLPLSAFVAYEIIENLVELLIQREADDQEWFFKTVVHSEETRGCLSDMCAIKPQISFKIRTGDICGDCMAILKLRLNPPMIKAIIEMLEETRLVALRRMEEPRASNLMLSALVDNRYPFPIAYCFRAMRSEFAYSRKWSFMYDVYKLVIKYLAFALLADRRRGAVGGLNSLDVSELRRGSDGQWGWVAFQLAEEIMRKGEGTFFSEFARTVTSESLEAAVAASKSFVQSRNEQQGHGWTGPEQTYQKLFERHIEDLHTLLTFIKPLANYDFVTPAGPVQSAASEWRWEAKYMMGSNPVFARSPQITKEHPKDHCVLVDKNRGLLSLHPWVILDYCESCFREMVFLYSKLNADCADHTEYPTNHHKTNRELGQVVKQELG